MQAQQAFTLQRRSFSTWVAVVATLAAAVLLLALVQAANRPAASTAPSLVVVSHQQAPDAVERNQLFAAQRDPDRNQAPDAKDRNAALSQGR